MAPVAINSEEVQQNGKHQTADAKGLAAARKKAVPNILKERLEAGRLAHSFSIKLISNVEIVQYAAAAGYDAILIDLEHSQFSLSTSNQLSCVALSAG